MIKAIAFCIVFTVLLALFSLVNNFVPSEYERFSYGIIGTGVALLVTWIFLRFEKRLFCHIGLLWSSQTLKRFCFGLAIGLLLATVMTLLLIQFTDLTITFATNYSITAFFILSVALVPLAFMEEVAFRAYPFLSLRSTIGIWGAQIVIAVLFALYHVAGGESLIGSLLGPGIWAFVFGLVAMRSGGIAMPTGVHLGVNIIRAAIGQHKGISPIWTINYSTNGTPAMEQNVETIASILQIILLVACVIAIEAYRRKKRI